MKIGPKYKIARRVGAPIFEKTQGAKFAASKERKGKFGPSRPKSAFGKQLNEKQKVRLTYGISDKQFKNYCMNILDHKTGSQTEKLYETLERRLDNVVFRLGLASTRRQARQLVSHGHITVNGRRVTVPSYDVEKGDAVAVRVQSQANSFFRSVEEKIKDAPKSDWVTYDLRSKQGTITGVPKYSPTSEHFDLEAVFEYYRR